MNKEEYLQQFFKEDLQILRELKKQEEERDDICPSIGPEAGKLLALLIRVINAQRVLELGTSIGYSTIWLAWALGFTGGHLVTVEQHLRLCQETKQNLLQAGLDSLVEIIQGDAADVMQQLDGPFDFILQDSGKALYPVMLDRSVELLRPRGLLIADDVLFKVLGVRKSLGEATDRYNRMIFNHPRLYSTILPIGDGLAVSMKI